MKYQIVVLEAIGGYAETLCQTLGRHVDELNLTRRLIFSPLSILLASSSVVIPVVSSLEDYQSKVPRCLYPINGMSLDSADHELDRVADLVLELSGPHAQAPAHRRRSLRP